MPLYMMRNKMKENVPTIKYGETRRVADIRKLFDMKDVIFDTEWLKLQQNLELYYMYRDLYKNESDYAIIKENSLRYDITIIPPQMLGKEFIKTAGHYHPMTKDANLSYTEIYQVLEGEAIYLLQKKGENKEFIDDVIVIKAEAGDNVIIPPNYGHITINKSDKILKMANWVCGDFSSEYEEIKEKNGGAYFLTTKGFVKNPKYDNLPEIRYLEPTNFSEYGFEKGLDMYRLISNNVHKLKFLTNPNNFSKLFSKIINR